MWIQTQCAARERLQRHQKKKKRKKCQQAEEHRGIYVTKYMDKDEE